MRKGTRFCISPTQSHQPCFKKSSTQESKSIDYRYPNIAKPTLVLPAVDDVNRKSITAPKQKT